MQIWCRFHICTTSASSLHHICINFSYILFWKNHQNILALLTWQVCTPKPDVHKFSKVQGFNSKVHQSLMYTSWKYTLLEAWMYTCELSMWCSCEICMSLYLWLEMYDVLLRFACLCTCDLKCMMKFWDLHVFVLVTWNVWCTFEICKSLYLWLGMYDVLLRCACLRTCDLKRMMFLWYLHVFVLMA